MTTSTTYICDVCGAEQSTCEQFWTFGLSLKPQNSSAFVGGHVKTFDACRACAEKFRMLPYVKTPKPETPPSIPELLREILTRLQDEE